MKPVLFLPIIDWEFRTQRPQHLAACFARAGHRVYYASLRLDEAPAAPREVASGLWRCELRGDPALNPYRDQLSAEAVERALAHLVENGVRHPLGGCWIVTQLPYWRPLAERLREQFDGFVLYDCIDDMAEFADHSDLRQDELALARSADLVSVTADRLAERWSPHSRRLLVVRNGCDPEHFGVAAVERCGRDGVVIGFFGGIHEWFDTELVAAIARLRPEWSFWLIGDTYGSEVGPLRALENVTLFGEIPYANLPSLVAEFDVGVIPFRRTALTEATNPVKVYEMLAAALPVVGVALPELRLLEPHVRLAATAEEFVEQIEAGLRSSAADRTAGRDFAIRQSWTERFLALRAAILAARPEAANRRSPAPVSEPTLSEPTQPLAASPWLNPFHHISILDAERESLTRQRDRIEREADRLRCELGRVERERAQFEVERAQFEDDLRGVTSSKWHRLGNRLRSWARWPARSEVR